MEECGVDPDYREMGLHTALSARRIRIARELGYRCAFVTVSPLNLPSLKVQFKHGFQIVAAISAYGGFSRFVLQRDLTQRDTPAPDTAAIFLDSKDARIVKYLDEGFAGVGVEPVNGSLQIKFVARATIIPKRNLMQAGLSGVRNQCGDARINSERER
jgi:GNAT superfamily N-acetyltransferase